MSVSLAGCMRFLVSFTREPFSEERTLKKRSSGTHTREILLFLFVLHIPKDPNMSSARKQIFDEIS